jgi:general secretion pathway protein E
MNALAPLGDIGSVALPERADFEPAFAERLLQDGKLNAASLDRVRRVCSETGNRFESILIDLGLVSEADVVAAMAGELGLEVAAGEDFPDEPVLDDSISRKFLREARVFALEQSEDVIRLAMADPLDSYVRQAIALSCGRQVAVMLAAPSDIAAAHERQQAGGRSQLGRIVDELDEVADAGATEDIDRLRDLASEAPVIRLVNLLIVNAIETRASDIHIEPFRNRLIVRYRVDGILVPANEPPARLRAAVVSRIKIMARLNIAERRLPQDGRIRFTFRGRELDLRVSTMPTMYGETVVMRILDRTKLVDSFATLGFLPDSERQITELLQRPQGIVLVTGPTGSGKTTTLYTGLLQLNHSDRKLYTVEDPIEYELEGVNQVQVKSQIGLTFAQVLRSILRQDPDIIMVGEIRDLETAEVAIQASLTGHLVLSTLHTNDAAGSVTRLLDMGTAEYMITSTVAGVVAQRLVRCLCASCRQTYQPEAGLLHRLAPQICEPGDSRQLYRAVGCPDCHGSGYRGRMTISEILIMSDELRALVAARVDAATLRKAAIRAGMRSMQTDGLQKALAGLTTADEVLRVTRDS